MPHSSAASAHAPKCARGRLQPLGADLRPDLRPAVPSRAARGVARRGRGGGRGRRDPGRRRRHRPRTRAAARRPARHRHRHQRGDARTSRAIASPARACGRSRACTSWTPARWNFPTAQFDVALAPYVMSVVPNPARVLERDVARRAAGRADGGDEPFRRRGRPARASRSGDGEVAGWLGWHPKFPYAAVGDWIAAQPTRELVERRELAPLRLFTLLRVRKASALKAGAERASAGDCARSRLSDSSMRRRARLPPLDRWIASLRSR